MGEADSAGAGRREADPNLLSLVLPAYNEARRLPASLARCAEYFRARGLAAEIIIVNDGSTDDTDRVCAEAIEDLTSPGVAFHCLSRKHAGKGAAVRAGVSRATGDPIAFLDADLTIPVEILDSFLRALNDGADIAIASRYVAGSSVQRPIWRRLVGNAFRTFVRILVPTGVQDTQCGGKAYTAEAAKVLFSAQRLDGFAFDAEVLFLAHSGGYQVREIPFTLHQENETTIDFLTDAPRMLSDLLRIRFNALRGTYR